jgi:hypothetical protein
MVKIRDYEIKQDIKELTITEFEKVSAILNNEELDKFESWADVFIYLGVPVEEVNDMEFDEFIKYVKDFNDSKIEANLEMTKTIEVEGYTYQAFEDEFKLKVKDLKLIEKAITSNAQNYFAKLMSIIFKRTDLSNAEHYDNAHLKHKEKLFKDLSAELVVPYVVFVSKKLTNRKDEPAEIVE